MGHTITLDITWAGIPVLVHGLDEVEIRKAMNL